jgi:hypothetical protein
MARSWVLPLAMLPLVACKPKQASDAPYREVQRWTIAEIEAELAHNDQVLAGEGIMVAMAAPTVAAPEADEPAAEEPTPAEDDGSGGATPEPQRPEPGPTPATMPPEADATSRAETLAGDRADLDGPAERHRASRRRLAARRDTDTRCERVCRLAEATCELETQICELAARHPDEPRYARACLRAEQQCEAASAACERCED